MLLSFAHSEPHEPGLRELDIGSDSVRSLLSEKLIYLFSDWIKYESKSYVVILKKEESFLFRFNSSDRLGDHLIKKFSVKLKPGKNEIRGFLHFDCREDVNSIEVNKDKLVVGLEVNGKEVGQVKMENPGDIRMHVREQGEKPVEYSALFAGFSPNEVAGVGVEGFLDLRNRRTARGFVVTMTRER